MQRPASLLKKACLTAFVCLTMLSSAWGSGVLNSGIIQEKEEEREKLLHHLESLPPYQPYFMNGMFGYHSTLFPESPEPLNSYIEFKLPSFYKVEILSIVLVPAYNPRFGTETAYGFPKRFSVDLFSSDSPEPTRVVDCSATDFPVPGLHPVVFSNINTRATTIRINVNRGVVQNGQEYYAFGEIYIFIKNSFGWVANVAAYRSVDISGSDSFESPPFWSKDYINDEASVLHLPLGAHRKTNTDYIATLSEGQTNDVELIFDMGELTRLATVRFFPALPPWDITLPHFGYPGRVVIEGFASADFSQKPVIKWDKATDWNRERFSFLGDNYFSVPLYAKWMRYLRFTFGDFPTYGDQRVFAIGEIGVYTGGHLIPEKIDIRINGLPEGSRDIHPLVDKHVYGHEILPTRDWLFALAQRRSVELKLASVEAQLTGLQLQRKRSITKTTTAGLLLTALLAIILHIRSRLQHHRETQRIRGSISRDLHDDVGSNIGALSMGLELLKGNVVNDIARTAVVDLQQICREATVGLRESISMTRNEPVTLHDFVSSMRERVMFILGPANVEFIQECELVDRKIPLVLKRNMMLIFKEILHNHQKHSQAERIHIRVGTTQTNDFFLEARDDGVGFELGKKKEGHWGMETMKERAKEIGAELKIQSAVGEGVTVRLTIPSESFSRKDRLK